MSLSSLPVELVRWVLEIMVDEAESRHVDSSLALVSKVVRHCVNPILYNTVVLVERYQVERFHYTVHLAECYVADYVRKLAIFNHTRSRTSLEVVSRCTQLERLVLGVWPGWRSDIESFPQPWEVVLLAYGYPWTASMNHLIQNVTHLYYSAYWFGGQIADVAVDVCQILPRLTHFGFMCSETEDQVESMLRVSKTRQLLLSNPSLKMVLLHSFSVTLEPSELFEGPMWVDLAKLQDDRLLARVGLQDEEFVDILESGGSTIWDNGWERFGNWRDIVRSHN